MVYMDESYIHKNYHRHDDSLFDPNDEQDLERIAQHKRKHYFLLQPLLTMIKVLMCWLSLTKIDLKNVRLV